MSPSEDRTRRQTSDGDFAIEAQMSDRGMTRAALIADAGAVTFAAPPAAKSA